MKPKIESGADKRTRSNVSFGEPRLNKQFYDTTMGSNFKPSTVPYSYNRINAYKDSVVPLDYYGELVGILGPVSKRILPFPQIVDVTQC